MEGTFEINAEGKIFNFLLDKQGTVWLIENENESSNFGQERPVASINEARETAKLMLHAMGKIRIP